MRCSADLYKACALSVSLLVQVIWYWSISRLVLEYLITSIAFEANLLPSGNPVNGFYIFVKLHRLGYTCLFESYLDNLLLFGRKNNLTSSSLEVLVSSEVAGEQRHELVILVRVHPLLEVYESFGKSHGPVAYIVCAVCLLAALGGIDEFQECSQLLMPAIGQLPQTGVGHRAVGMEAERIVCRYVLVYLCCLFHCFTLLSCEFDRLEINDCHYVHCAQSYGDLLYVGCFFAKNLQPDRENTSHEEHSHKKTHAMPSNSISKMSAEPPGMPGCEK